MMLTVRLRLALHCSFLARTLGSTEAGSLACCLFGVTTRRALFMAADAALWLMLQICLLTGWLDACHPLSCGFVFLSVNLDRCMAVWPMSPRLCLIAYIQKEVPSNGGRIY